MTTTEVTATGVDDGSLRSLRGWNLGLTVLHLGQAVAVLALATDFSITVSRSLPAGAPGARPGRRKRCSTSPSPPRSPCSSRSPPSTTC